MAVGCPKCKVEFLQVVYSEKTYHTISSLTRNDDGSVDEVYELSLVDSCVEDFEHFYCMVCGEVEVYNNTVFPEV